MATKQRGEEIWRDLPKHRDASPPSEWEARYQRAPAVPATAKGASEQAVATPRVAGTARFKRLSISYGMTPGRPDSSGAGACELGSWHQ
jgi:hypothetical protein